LAKAMLPNGKIKEIGIREGEKLHEVMVTKDDSYLTYEYDRHYIIYPHFEWWKFDPSIIGNGMKVSDGFEYSSGTNKQWMSVDDIAAQLKLLQH
jgi:FlaA1/EpsC-like NDP-sugar epimerase